MDKTSYAMGLSIAQNLLRSGIKEIDLKDFSEAIRATLAGEKPQMSLEEANKALEDYFNRIAEEQAAEAAEVGKVMKEEGEKFLAANKLDPDVHTLASGLQYKIVRRGTGHRPGPKDQVQCDYEGRFTNGQVFDSSYKRGEPAVFGVNQVIKGWQEALQLMSEGSEWEIYVPYTLGYGEIGAQGAIPPYAALVFKIELHKVL